MSLARIALAALLAAAAAAPPAAAQSGNFILRLGRDTTSVEHFTVTPARTEVDQVGRSPRVLQRHAVYEFGANDAMTRASVLVTRPGVPAGAPPFQALSAVFTSDSMRLETRRDTVTQSIRAAVPAGAVVVIGSPWIMYDRLCTRLVAAKGDSLRVPFYFAGAPAAGSITARRLGRDGVEIVTPYDRYRGTLDRAGHLVHLDPISGTQQFTLDRVPTLDVAGMTASFLAAEQQSGSMGAYSPRDTVRAKDAGGASLWIDYGRPSRRGRSIFGGVVPWGQVWRTGANAATQFKTDKALVMGGTTVPAGFYTLWSIPSPDGWKLLINGETGQWGTEHKAEKDLYTIPMAVTALADPVEKFTIGIAPSATGGVLTLDWDATRASVPFTVKP